MPYFHATFTIPQPLRKLARQHQKALYPLLMKAAARALIKLAADPHYVGGLLGVLAVLHTWGRTLTCHPHVHCLVPGGVLSPDGQWRPAREGYLVPAPALSPRFRGIFLDLVRKALPDVVIPNSVRKQAWVVHCKPAVRDAENVLTYLGRYVHRIAITNGRILSVDDSKVTFRYKKVGETSWRTMTLRAEEFIRRFLQHVLPKGVHKVRYCGLWAPSNKARLQQLRQRLTADNTGRALPAAEDSGGPLSPHADSQPTRCSLPVDPRHRMPLHALPSALPITPRLPHSRSHPFGSVPPSTVRLFRIA